MLTGRMGDFVDVPSWIIVAVAVAVQVIRQKGCRFRLIGNHYYTAEVKKVAVMISVEFRYKVLEVKHYRERFMDESILVPWVCNSII